MELLARAKRRLRHFDRRAEPTPDGDDRRCCKREEAGRNAHRGDFPAGDTAPVRLSCVAQCCQARRRAVRLDRRRPTGPRNGQ